MTHLDTTRAQAGLSVHDTEIAFDFIPSVVPCFLPGTTIATPRGPCPVEDMRPGDMVLTRDNGIQPVQWTGGRDLSQGELRTAPDLRPIRIRAGALGPGMPARDLMVSPSHRVLVTPHILPNAGATGEELHEARDLVGLPGIAQVDTDGLRYIHFMLDRHEVVLSDGAWTESFRPEYLSLCGLEEASRQEILHLFPELRRPGGLSAYGLARPIGVPDRAAG